MARTSSAHLQRPLLDVAGDPMRLFSMEANWTRTSYRKDPVSGIYLPGDLLEPQGIQRMCYTTVFSSWSVVGSAAVAANDTAAPNGLVKADKITLPGSGDRIWYNPYNGSAADQPTAVSMWIKRVASSGTFDIQHPNALSYGRWTVDLSLLSDSWERIDRNHAAVTVTFEFKTYTAPNHQCGLNIVWASGSPVFHAWNASVVEHSSRMTQSDIINTAGSGTVTRTADGQLIYDLGAEMSGGQEGTILFPVCFPEHTPTADQNFLALVDASDAANHYVAMRIHTDKKMRGWVKAGGSIGATSSVADLSDGKVHWAGLSWKPDCSVLFFDDEVVGEFAGVGAPTGLDSLRVYPVGQWTGGVHVWPKFHRTMPRPIQPQLLAA